jgi:DNA-binding cell septation regulator SpoVG
VPGGPESGFENDGASPASFSIRDLKRVQNESKLRATAKVVIDSVVTLDVVLFEGRDGLFVRPAAARAANGEYLRTFGLHPSFASAILEQIERQLAGPRRSAPADRNRKKPTSVGSPTRMSAARREELFDHGERLLEEALARQ